MPFADTQKLISQGTYAKKLRPFLPDDAFAPDPTKLAILFAHVAILLVGWIVANRLNDWPIYLLWLYLPIALAMGNSIMVLAFSSHGLMHGTVIRNTRITQLMSLLGFTMIWMPPTLWKSLHNRVHHNQTNGLGDPDRNYLYEQPKTWANWYQNLFIPSMSVNPILLAIGMATAWGIYAFRNLTSVLLFNSKTVSYVPAAFTVNAKDRRAIAGELLVVLSLHLSILAYLQFDFIKIIFAYFLPIWIGYSGLIFYIYTNHMGCPMTNVNDPLINSVSLRVPKIVDRLHLNFSYHAEHHIFPGLNSDYYPMVRELLKIHYPERMNYILTAGEAWRLLLTTPRYYKDETTFTNWSGEASVSCHLNTPSDKDAIKTAKDPLSPLTR